MNEVINEQDERYRSARERVEELRSFYTHLAIYLVVNVLLLAINLLTAPGDLWFVWPVLGWGIGLLSHAASVFGLFGIGGTAWQERKIRELMLRERLQSGKMSPSLRSAAGKPADLDRLTRRVENLETIVTSAAWDRLNVSDADADSSEEETTAEKTERLARQLQSSSS